MDISRYVRDGLGNTMTAEQRKAMQKQLAEQRWEDFKTGRPALDNSRAMQMQALVEDNPNPVVKEFADFYAQPRGYAHNATAEHTLSSNLAFMNYELLDHLADISPRPVLLIAGDHAHSLYFSQDAYKQLKDPKELYLVKGAGHVDLYDKLDLIPFDKIEDFLKKALA